MRRTNTIKSTSKLTTLVHCCFWTALALAVAGCDAVSTGSLGLGGVVVTNQPTTANGESYALIGERLLTVSADDGVIANDAAASSVVAASGETEFGGVLQLNEDGSFFYEAPEDFYGTDKFDYSVLVDGGTMTGTASIKVYPADATPVP